MSPPRIKDPSQGYSSINLSASWKTSESRIAEYGFTSGSCNSSLLGEIKGDIGGLGEGGVSGYNGGRRTNKG